MVMRKWTKILRAWTKGEKMTKMKMIKGRKCKIEEHMGIQFLNKRSTQVGGASVTP